MRFSLNLQEETVLKIEQERRLSNSLKIGKNMFWVFYISDNVSLEPEKTGKWMYFFNGDADIDYISKLCSDAVEQGIVDKAKHTNPDTLGLNPHGTSDSGVCCFYLNYDDIEGHKRILTYFLENQMIKRTKAGKLYNISFKLDNQTKQGEYGSDFTGVLKLADFVDLNTGEWIYTKEKV